MIVPKKKNMCSISTIGVAVLGRSWVPTFFLGKACEYGRRGGWLFFRDRLNLGGIPLVVLLTHLISKLTSYFCKILSLWNTYKNQHINNNTCIYINLTNITHCGTLQSQHYNQQVVQMKKCIFVYSCKIPCAIFIFAIIRMNIAHSFLHKNIHLLCTNLRG